MRLLIPILLLCILWGFPAVADVKRVHSKVYQFGDIGVADLYISARQAGAQSFSGYMVITNSGDIDDRLLDVQGDFPKVEIHNTIIKDNQMHMMHLRDGVALPSKKTIFFESGGKHIMFMGVDGQDFTVGQHIKLTLVFEKAGKQQVEFVVQ